MSNQFPPSARPSQSANDNGPLTSGQVKALKIAIGVMSFMIVAALVAIVGRVIYLAAVKKADPIAATPPSQVSSELVPTAAMSLPAGAKIDNMSLNGNRLLVHYHVGETPGAAIVDLTTGKTLTRIKFEPAK